MRAQRYIALCLWLVFAGMFFSLAGQWIGLTSSDREFKEYAESLFRRSTLDRRSASDIRNLLLAKAGQLSIPVQSSQINVTGQGESLRTIIAYDTEIKIPLMNRVLYRMQFIHNLGK